MKPYQNNVLVLFLKSGKKLTYSTPPEKTRKDALYMVLQTEKIDPKDITKAFFVPQSEYGSIVYSDTLGYESQTLDLKITTINDKLPIIRKERDLILQKLDIEFMRILEEEEPCEVCKKHLIAIKKYLRNVPELFADFKFKDLDQIKSFNIFDNIFDIIVTEEGSGYSSPPEITIEKPNNHPSLPGFPLKCIPIVEDGKIKQILTKQVGSSYISPPTIEIAPPDQEGGVQAKAIASPPENNGQASSMITNILRSKSLYSNGEE